jgi:large exoprotein involved in heme utilization and adhesion
MKHRHHFLVSTTAAVTLLASPLEAGGPALPTGGQTVGGSATVSSSGNTLTINQTTNSAIINWNTFNIGAGGSVRINQP